MLKKQLKKLKEDADKAVKEAEKKLEDLKKAVRVPDSGDASITTIGLASSTGDEHTLHFE